MQSAKQTSDFDLVYSQIALQQLQDYAATLKKLYGTTTKQAEKDLLSADYEEVQLLISQIPYAQQNLESAQ
jgi:hypothetical protein